MKKALLGFIVLCLLGSCSTYKPFTSTVKPAEINKTGILPPINILKFIDVKENEKLEIRETTKQLTYDLNEKTKLKTEDALTLAGVSYEHLLLNQEEEHVLDGELLRYLSIFNKLAQINSSYVPEISNTKKNRAVFNNIVVSDSIVKLLENKNSRYALSIINFGTTRTPKQDTKRRLMNTTGFAVAAGFAALTGFGFWVKELAYVNTVYVFIIDAKEKRLAFFNSRSEVIDPLNDELTKKQLYSCFEDYWIWYHPEAQKHLKIVKK